MNRRALSLWAPVALYMAAIFTVSSLPQLPPPPGGVSFATAHILEYAGLAILLVRALAGGFGEPVSLRVTGIAIGIAIAYGATDEWHQRFVPPRHMDPYDLLADAAGACAGAAVMYARRRIIAVRGL